SCSGGDAPTLRGKDRRPGPTAPASIHAPPPDRLPTRTNEQDRRAPPPPCCRRRARAPRGSDLGRPLRDHLEPSPPRRDDRWPLHPPRPPAAWFGAAEEEPRSLRLFPSSPLPSSRWTPPLRAQRRPRRRHPPAADGSRRSASAEEASIRAGGLLRRSL